MLIDLLESGGIDPGLIIGPITLVILITAIVLLVKFWHTIKMKSKYNSFYMTMERLNDRSKKKRELEVFLRDCYFSYTDNKRTCPICGKRFLVTESVTDSNGDVSVKHVKKSCPRCSAFFTTAYSAPKCDGNMQSKYKNNYDLLIKYINAYNPQEPNYSDGGGDGIHGTFIPD